MITFEILSEGNHIVPVTIKATFPINVSVGSIQTIHVLTSIQGTELDEFAQAYAYQTENAYKTLPEFTVQDETRNATFQLNTIGQSIEDPEKTVYEISIAFTIENAEVEKTVTTQTDLTGEDKTAFLQSVAEGEAINYKYGMGFTDL